MEEKKEEKELFQNKTRYSEKEYTIFLKSYQKEYSAVDSISTLFYIIVLGFCLIFAIHEKAVLLSIFVAVIFVGFIYFKFIWPNKRIEKEKVKPQIQEEFINTFKFYNRYFTISNPEGKSNIFYFKIYKVIETKTHYYIYISRDNAFMLSKHGFIDCNSEDFRAFIRKHAIFKYKRQN